MFSLVTPKYLEYFMSKLYFFRHGQASLGGENYDILSEKGKHQSQLLGKHLSDQKIHFDKVYVGPLARQKDTYKLVKQVYQQQQISLPKPIEVEGLREHQGIEAMKMALPKLITTNDYLKSLQADSKKKPENTLSNSMKSFHYFLTEWAQGNIAVEGVRDWTTFRNESRQALNHILESTHSGETIGVFSSGGTISAITAECLGLANEKSVAELNFSIRNTAITTFLYSGNQFNLLTFNELPHLNKSMVTFI